MQAGHTPLHIAVRVGSREDVRALLLAIGAAAQEPSQETREKMVHFLREPQKDRINEKSLAANAESESESDRDDWRATLVAKEDVAQMVMKSVTQLEARERALRLFGAESNVSPNVFLNYYNKNEEDRQSNSCIPPRIH